MENIETENCDSVEAKSEALCSCGGGEKVTL